MKPFRAHDDNTRPTMPSRDSLMCASAGQRLGIAAACVLALWVTVLWATQ